MLTIDLIQNYKIENERIASLNEYPRSMYAVCMLFFMLFYYH